MAVRLLDIDEEGVVMDRNDKQEQKNQKVEADNSRNWEQSEWFRKWLEIIRQRTPQRAAA
jgi:hypothetical protein